MILYFRYELYLPEVVSKILSRQLGASGVFGLAGWVSQVEPEAVSADR